MIHTGLAQSNDVMMTLFSLALLGSLSGFLFFNFNPAKVFMGDCGSLFIGFTIASASVMCVSKSATLVGLALPALALGIPIFDTLFSMLRRFLERRSLFAPDRSHFHHRLLALGLNQRRAVMITYIATLIFASVGLLMMISSNIGSLVVFGVVLCLILLLFRAVGAVRLQETLARLQSKYRHSRGEREDRRTFEHLQLKFCQAHDAGQSWQAICEAARQMDFAWVCLKTTREDGRAEEELWRTPDSKLDLSRVITMTIPLRGRKEGLSRQLEIAISVNGSLEAASHRVTLIGRLIDEQDLAAIAPIARKGRL
jgi:UDP-GlcNAc:undecaprenyl-phosphate GlcNAc-1-phosphate transferase